MLTKEYILDCLNKYGCFDELTSENFYHQVISPLLDNQCFNPARFSWNDGATKGVLIFDDLDIVIKIPFEGESNYTCSHYEDENGEWHTYSHDGKYSYQAGVEEFSPYDGATGSEREWDYCEVEARLCELANQKKLAGCFAQTKFLGLANEHPIYYQDKCFMFCDARSSTKREAYRLRTKSDYDSLQEVRKRVGFYSVDCDWLLDFLIYWGEPVLEELVQFINAQQISDLHDGNIGYRGGVPCLVDYSSYHH